MKLTYDVSTVYNEDVYIFAVGGELLACREREPSGIKNLFDIIDPSDAVVLRKEINSFFAENFLYVESLLGPMIIERSLLERLGALIAIIPHSAEDFSYGGDGLSIRRGGEDFIRAIAEESSRYRAMISRTSEGMYALMRDFSMSCGALFGCELDLSADITHETVLKDHFDAELYALMVSCISLLCRSYADARRGEMRICFENGGVYADIAMTASETRRLSELRASVGKCLLLADSCGVPYSLTCGEDRIKLRIYPRVTKLRGTEVKEKIARLDMGTQAQC